MSAALHDLRLKLLQRWQALSTRDQRAVYFLVLALVPALLYFMAVYPLQNARARLNKAIAEHEQQLQYMQTSAQTLISLRGSGVGNERNGRTLMQISTESAQEHELKVSRMQPRNDTELQIWLDEVAYDQVLRWIYDLETRYGVTIALANITAGNGVGLVRVNLKLKDGGA